MRKKEVRKQGFLSRIPARKVSSMQLRGWLHARMMLETAGRVQASSGDDCSGKGSTISGRIICLAGESGMIWELPNHEKPEEALSHWTRMVEMKLNFVDRKRIAIM